MSKTQLPSGCRISLEEFDTGRYKVVIISDKRRYRRFLYVSNDTKLKDAEQSLISAFKVRYGDA